MKQNACEMSQVYNIELKLSKIQMESKQILVKCNRTSECCSEDLSNSDHIALACCG